MFFCSVFAMLFHFRYVFLSWESIENNHLIMFKHSSVCVYVSMTFFRLLSCVIKNLKSALVLCCSFC